MCGDSVVIFENEDNLVKHDMYFQASNILGFMSKCLQTLLGTLPYTFTGFPASQVSVVIYLLVGSRLLEYLGELQKRNLQPFRDH